MFNEKKKLSLDDFKAQANNEELTAMMDSIKGGIVDSCHVTPRGSSGGGGASDPK